MEEYENILLDRQDYKMTLRQEYIELFFYTTLCFFIPFLFGHSQWITGTLVNAALILGALNLKKRMIIPIILLPSIAVLSKGIIFGPFTIFLLSMMPFIWISNIILVYAFKKLRLEKKMNSFIVLIIGAGTKTTFLFIIALILYNIGHIPALFLGTMGLMQLYTALSGGIIALGIQEAKKKLVKS